MRPRNLIDIKCSRRNPEHLGKKRINLNSSQIIFIPIKSLIRTTLVILVVLSFVFGSVMAPIDNDFLTQAAQNNEERAQLEIQLADLESQISEYEETILGYKSQGKNLKSEISRLNAKVSKINLQIKAINLSLKKLDRNIVDTQSQISQTEININFNKETLSQLLQNIYENEAENLIEVLLKNSKLSDFFGNLNSLLAIQDSLRISLQKIVELHHELIDQKEILALERVDAIALKNYQGAQKSNIQKIKTKKDNLLVITKGEESKYTELLAKTEKTAAEIRKQIFKLIGGGELSFEDAYNLAKFAEQTTNIRAALILAVLDQESALGRNVGRCKYEIAMHPTRDIPPFLAIIKELNLTKNLESGIIKVSCAISADGAYGGAMGPAQFIPSTWAIYGGYKKNSSGIWKHSSSKDYIGKITGNKPSSPWRNTDAFIATALYLKDAYNSKSCRNYSQRIPSQSQMLQERCAAAKYYAGGRWYYYRWAYGEPVIERADRFQKYINILNS
ncbi:MAG TPA: hypothetical protein ENH26_00235 [Candidatus Wolfebacteria bacterium]|nr:hypothetical protein [Candidatus Wolfebacteria bacterium]